VIRTSVCCVITATQIVGTIIFDRLLNSGFYVSDMFCPFFESSVEEDGA
jgi:hypothetical protein